MLDDQVSDSGDADIEARFGDTSYERLLFEQSPDAIFVQDFDGNVLDVNRAACLLHKIDRDELIGMNVVDLVPDEHKHSVRAGYSLLVDGQKAYAEGMSLSRDGDVVPVEIRTAPITYNGESALLMHVRDVRERVELQQKLGELQSELEHATRLTTMGELAGGLAHELNQPLFAITNFAESCVALVEKGEASDEKVLERLRQIANEAGRAGSIIGGLRRFVQKNEPRLSDVVIDTLLTDMKLLLGGELKRSQSHLILDLEPGLAMAKCDPIQIQQIVVNLVRNGIDAMAELPVPQRSVTVSAAVVSEQMLEIAVCDQGCGLPPGAVDNVFDAFFTTKASGLGLGLAISKSMAKSVGGDLTAERNTDSGTTFRLTIPTGARPPSDNGIA
jgi:PAS domain S-box-containing protein